MSDSSVTATSSPMVSKANISDFDGCPPEFIESFFGFVSGDTELDALRAVLADSIRENPGALPSMRSVIMDAGRSQMIKTEAFEALTGILNEADSERTQRVDEAAGASDAFDLSQLGIDEADLEDDAGSDSQLSGLAALTDPDATVRATLGESDELREIIAAAERDAEPADEADEPGDQDADVAALAGAALARDETAKAGATPDAADKDAGDPDRQADDTESEEDAERDPSLELPVLEDAVNVPLGIRAAPRRIAPGTTLSDRFVLVSHLDAGTIGEVFKAIDLKRKKSGDPEPWVAAKVISHDFDQAPKLAAALDACGDRIAALDHPNVIDVVLFDRDGDHFYLVMEWLDGESLVSLLDRYRYQPLPGERSREILRGAVDGLKFAHDEGVMHGDIKPGNIFITHDGSAKLLDFGLAAASRPRTTPFDPEVLGAHTRAFASCEVLEGKEPAAADDVYALAAVAYRLLSGRRVFGKRNALEAEAAGIAPEPVEGLADREWEILRQALAFRREDRVRELGLLREVFDAPVKDGAAAARKSPPRPAPARQTREHPAPRTGPTIVHDEPAELDSSPTAEIRFQMPRNPAVMGGIAAGVLALLAIGAWLIFGGAEEPAVSVVSSPGSAAAPRVTSPVPAVPEAAAPATAEPEVTPPTPTVGAGEAVREPEPVPDEPQPSALDVRMTELAEKTFESLDQGRLTVPDGDNAKFYVLAMQAIAPDSGITLETRDRVTERMLLQSQRALDDGQLTRSERWLDEARALGASESQLESMTATIAAAREEARLAEQRAAERRRSEEQRAAARQAEERQRAEEQRRLAEQRAAEEARLAAEREAAGSLPRVADAAAPAETTPANAGPPVPVAPADGIETVALSTLEFRRFVEPEYPRRESSRRASGWVLVEFVVNKRGVPEDISIVGAEPDGRFDEAAEKAVKKWRFKPVVVDGESVKRRTQVRLRFEAV